MITHILSELILSITSFAVFIIYFQQKTIYTRLLWGVFLITIALTALLTVVWSIGVDALSPVVYSFRRLENTLAPICMMIVTWGLISHTEVTRFVFWGTIGTGAGLYFGLVWYRMEALIQVVQPLCIVISMIIACFGLIKRQKSALWVIFAMTVLALSSKLRLVVRAEVTIDPYHVLVAISTIFLGKAVQFEHKTLFK
jgi:hypothetical protein